jgi:hypothetical protein
MLCLGSLKLASYTYSAEEGSGELFDPNTESVA